jgi:nucleoside-diphosphate-sugar epimerase
METDPSRLTVHSSYNIGGVSFSPKELADEIKKHIPDFEIVYTPDYRQNIAESWPHSIDDSVANKDWGWKHNYDLSKMTDIMLKEIEKKLIV